MNDRMILGENAVYSSDSAETGLNNNILVVGASGSGKTVSIAEPLLLETTERSLIITLTKRSLAKKYKSVFRKRGYEVLDLDFTDPAHSTVGYDPLHFVSSQQDIRFLAEAIVKGGRNSDSFKYDMFWDNAAISLLCAEIAYIKIVRPDGSLADVLSFHASLKVDDGDDEEISTTLDREFDNLGSSELASFAVSNWKTYRVLPFKTAAGVYGTLQAAISSVFSDDLKRLMSADKQVDFISISSKKTILFVTTSPVNKSIHSVCNLFYGHAFKEMFEYAESRRNGKLPIPVHVLADDFATGGRVLNFDEYISIFREKGISCTLLLQSESQLESMYGYMEATTIINNCDSYVYFGGQDLQTAENISARLDAALEDVLYMPVGQEIIFRRGSLPKVTKRYNIFADERYQQIMKAYEKEMNSHSEERCGLIF